MPKTKRNASLIILVNKESKILMQHRTEDAPLYPGYWGFFGGGCNENETPEDCVKREVLEEIDYKLLNPKLLFSVDYDNDKHFGTKHYFFEEYDGKQEIVLKEGQGYSWIDLNDLGDYKIAPHNLEVIKKQFKI